MVSVTSIFLLFEALLKECFIGTKCNILEPTQWSKKYTEANMCMSRHFTFLCFYIKHKNEKLKVAGAGIT